MPRASSAERKRRFLADCCQELIAFQTAHEAGRLQGTRAATVERLRRALNPLGLDQATLLHNLRFFGTEEQRDAAKLAVRLVNAFDSKSRRVVARRDSRAANLSNHLSGGGNGRPGGRRRAASTVLVRIESRKSVKMVRRVLASANRTLRLQGTPRRATVARWEAFVLAARPCDVNPALWDRAQDRVLKALGAGA